VMTENALRRKYQEKNIYNLRLFGVYGKYDDWRYRLIPNLCCQAVFKHQLTVRYNHIYAFTHVDDLIKIVDWVITKKPTKRVYNVCSEDQKSFTQIATIVGCIARSKRPIRILHDNLKEEYSGNTYRLDYENEKLASRGFKSLKKGIQELYQWYLERKDTMNKDEVMKWI